MKFEMSLSEQKSAKAISKKKASAAFRHDFAIMCAAEERRIQDQIILDLLLLFLLLLLLLLPQMEEANVNMLLPDSPGNTQSIMVLVA